jgi:UDP:flavonoid glycosyltransferase YjiC (YdhE family)
VASPNFKDWVEKHGVEAAHTTMDIQAMMQGEGGHEWVDHGNNPARQLQVMKKLLNRYGMEMMSDSWNACGDAELVMSSFTSDVYAASIAEKLGVHHISTLLQPAMIPTRCGWAIYSAPRPDRRSIFNLWFGQWIIEPGPWKMLGDLNNQFRTEMLGLPAQSARENRAAMRRALTLQAFSPQVVPPPDDWPPTIHTTGYWFLDEGQDWQPPASLQAFLEAGEPPVYVGFGSMAGRNPEAFTRMVVEAVSRTRRRTVLQSGWAGMGSKDLPEHIHLLESAPHRWLFPCMGTVVHHGGAGTTAESLRAGVPTVIVPHIADQPYWGARVAALGVGPRPIPRPRLTAQRLAEAIRQAAEDEAMRQRAAELGAKIRAEDGIQAAVELIKKYLQGT